jgi:hypothetical protein
MISIALAARALAAARTVDPTVTPAAVLAAVEVAMCEQLAEVINCSRTDLRRRLEQLRAESTRPGPAGVASKPSPTSSPRRPTPGSR